MFDTSHLRVTNQRRRQQWLGGGGGVAKGAIAKPEKTKTEFYKTSQNIKKLHSKTNFIINIFAYRTTQ